MSSRSALLERLTLHTQQPSSNLTRQTFLYGTAWKKEATADLVYSALKNGFDGIDTAAQPKHYREDLVGAGLKRAIRDKLIRRSDVFVQTKFTPVSGQDPQEMPYKPEWPITEQVRCSVQSSLQNFEVPPESEAGDDTEKPYLNCVVLHSPLNTIEETMEAWNALESFVPGSIRSLGVSNITLPVLRTLHERATIKPAVVQNRFYASTKFDVELRRFCQQHEIIYQSFWTLSANPALLRSEPVRSMQNEMGISAAAALYCLVLGLGNTVVLNGTTSIDNMRADQEALRRAKEFLALQPSVWEHTMAHFKSIIGET